MTPKTDKTQLSRTAVSGSRAGNFRDESSQRVAGRTASSTGNRVAGSSSNAHIGPENQDTIVHDQLEKRRPNGPLKPLTEPLELIASKIPSLRSVLGASSRSLGDFYPFSPRAGESARKRPEKQRQKEPITLPPELLGLIASKIAVPTFVPGNKSTPLGDLKNFRLASRAFSRAAYHNIDLETRIVSGMVRKFIRGKKHVLPDKLKEKLSSAQGLDLSKTPTNGLDWSNAAIRGRQQYLTRIKQVLAESKNLRTLNLSGNQFGFVPEEIFELTALERLDLSDMKLGSLPAAIGNLVALKELNVSKNVMMFHPDDDNFSPLPETVRKLSALRKLSLGWNQFGDLPDVVCSLVSLQELNFEQTTMVELTEKIGNLVALQKLDLSENCINFLPKAIGNLVALQELNLSNSWLKALPEAFGKLVSLQRLYLNRTQSLRSFPDAFGNLEALRELYLRDSKLESLPLTFIHLGALKKIDLTGARLSSHILETVRVLNGLQIVT